MASPRLLTQVFALCTFAVVLAGCALGPIWARAIEGRGIDAETGQPVAGAEVFASYVASSTLDPSHNNYAFRWATRNVSTSLRHLLFEFTEQRVVASIDPPWVAWVG